MIKINKIKEKEITLIIKFIRKNLLSNKYFPKELIKSYLRETTAEYLRELFKTKGSIFLKAEENKEIVGILYGRYDYGIFWIEFIDVEIKNRRNGIASILLKELEKICKNKNIHKIHSDIPTSNIPSLKTFKENKYFVEAKMKKHWMKFNYYLVSKFI